MLDKRLKIFLHIVFWAFMFLSPMQYMRGTGMSMLQYMMSCMPSLLLMVVFYANYKWLTYRYFVEGKHRYYTIINFIMIISFAIFLHYWMDFTRDLFQPSYRLTRTPDALDDFLSFVRDIANFCIFATAATCIALAQQWYWADKALRNAEAARVAAELGNLRSQINPHFLLNTLNNIYALTAIDHTRAQSAIQQLSKMLRHMLYDNQEQLVSLTDEVQFIENYFNLMKIRLPKSVDVKLEKDLENPHTKVAPLLFISLVENAFKHGVSSTEPSFIHMTMTQKGNSLCVIIENSNFPKSEKDRSGHGIGLQQVQRRLDLAYYEHYEWTKGVNDDGTVYSSIIKITL
jgi:two-component sensor histidine kinase